MRLIATLGLPGSGKSYWAREFQKRSGVEQWVVITKDDIRSLLHDNQHTKTTEKFVLAARDALIRLAFANKKNVIVADTNFAPFHMENLKKIAKESNAEFSIEDFTHIPIEVCIERDLKRSKSVGEKVIRDMHDKYLRPVPPVISYNPALEMAVIVDIDGTVALMDRGPGGRSPYDWHKVGEDRPNSQVIDHLTILKCSAQEFHIIFVSGRDACCRKETEKWLYTHVGGYTHLYMRPEGDQRKDTIVKEEIYRNNIEGKYNVQCVFDDRNSVVAMWRSLGLTCLQVAEGNF